MYVQVMMFIIHKIDRKLVILREAFDDKCFVICIETLEREVILCANLRVLIRKYA